MKRQVDPEQQLKPEDPPYGVYKELNELFNQIHPLARRVQDLAGEFGFTHVTRAKDGCQIVITEPGLDVFVRRPLDKA